MSRSLIPRRTPVTALILTALVLTAVVTAGSAGRAQTATSMPVPPDGLWFTKDEESIIRVHPCAGDASSATPVSSYCGTMAWLKVPLDAKGMPKVDDLNKDPEKKGKPIIGLDILLALVPAGDHWSGQAYNPDDGKFYDITFKVKTSKTQNDQADLRGCILRVLCQTETFTRTAEVPGGLPVVAATRPAKAHPAKKDALAK